MWEIKALAGEKRAGTVDPQVSHESENLRSGELGSARDSLWEIVLYNIISKRYTRNAEFLNEAKNHLSFKEIDSRQNALCALMSKPGRLRTRACFVVHRNHECARDGGA